MSVKRLNVHRKLAGLGLALTVVVVVTGIVASLETARRAAADKRSVASILTSIPEFLLFFVLVLLALKKRRDPRTHKRLMLFAAISALPPDIGRLDFDLPFSGLVESYVSTLERGAQITESCRTVTSPDYPGVHAILEGGEVRRITVGQGSDVELVEGVGVGTAAKAVQAAFPGFRAEPHKYVAAPAKYLTVPNPAPGAPALRFEIGADDKVSMFHVGVKPTLDYVEGCA